MNLARAMLKGMISCRVFANDTASPSAALVCARRMGICFVAGDSHFAESLLSRLRAMSADEMARTRGVCEGLENRLYAASRKAVSAQQLYDMLKTKRYAHARMRRLALDAALGYTDELPELPPYVHVLGANATGLAVLKEAKKRAKLPVTQSLAQLGRHNAAAQQVAAAHAAAEDLVALCLAIPRPCGTAYTQKMIVRKEEET